MIKLDIMAIPLSQGLFALVDGEDYEELAQYKWFAHKSHYTFYAVRSRSKCQPIAMHQQIMQIPKGMECDHRNHCGLDNRKTNLRPCLHQENTQNILPKKGGTSKYKGVSWAKGGEYKGHKYKGKWRVRIGTNGKIPLGLYDDEIEAAKVYDQKAKELFGEFALTNFL